jgi:hypothetical protein
VISLPLGLSLVIWSCLVFLISTLEFPGAQDVSWLWWAMRGGFVVGVMLLCRERWQFVRHRRIERIEQHMMAPGTHWLVGAMTGRGASKPLGYGYVRRRA